MFIGRQEAPVIISECRIPQGSLVVLCRLSSRVCPMRMWLRRSVDSHGANLPSRTPPKKISVLPHRFITRVLTLVLCDMYTSRASGMALNSSGGHRRGRVGHWPLSPVPKIANNLNDIIIAHFQEYVRLNNLVVRLIPFLYLYLIRLNTPHQGQEGTQSHWTWDSGARNSQENNSRCTQEEIVSREDIVIVYLHTGVKRAFNRGNISDSFAHHSFSSR
uniref:Uncharacterized protein n=1 Tax=Timema poppense TaxID=170557 RepID=A0A7R9D965_TIMPO|nr:unnamed protein product [Timema poppensis]